MALIYIALGSNLGDRTHNIDLAQSLLKTQEVMIKRQSQLYETEALSASGQTDSHMPSFMNAVIEAETTLSPRSLLECLERVETSMGRTEKGQWKSRPIDLDLIFYGDCVISENQLEIPHPRMAERWFVLKPLADLAPEFVHPVLKKTVRELLHSVIGRKT